MSLFSSKICVLKIINRSFWTFFLTPPQLFVIQFIAFGYLILYILKYNDDLAQILHFCLFGLNEIGSHEQKNKLYDGQTMHNITSGQKFHTFVLLSGMFSRISISNLLLLRMKWWNFLFTPFFNHCNRRLNFQRINILIVCFVIWIAHNFQENVIPVIIILWVNYFIPLDWLYWSLQLSN